jgi:hypothetical protein
VVTAKTEFPEGAVRDCVVAMIAIKYTQVREREAGGIHPAGACPAIRGLELC